MVKGWQLSSKVRNKTRVPAFTTSIKHILECLARAIRQEKETKGIQIGRKVVKLSLFTDNKFCRAPKDFTHTHTHYLSELINNFSKVAEY